MKTFTFFITSALFLILGISTLQSQTIFLADLADPAAMVFDGANNLYFAELGNETISYIDPNDPNSEPTLFVSESGGVVRMLIHENTMYVSQAFIGEIGKIDLTVNPPVIESMATDLTSPEGMVIFDNYLYVAISGEDRIVKIDLNSSSPVMEDVLTGLNNPMALQIHGTELYFCESYASKISKIDDITATTPQVTAVAYGINEPFDIKINGEYMYVAESGGDLISRFIFTDENPVVEDLASSLVFPTSIEIIGSDLYITEFSAGIISKLENIVTPVNTYELNNNNMSLSPNPAHDYIYISNLYTPGDFFIHNVNGKKVLEGSLNENEKIDIDKLDSGMYFIKVNQSKTLKFIKQ